MKKTKRRTIKIIEQKTKTDLWRLFLGSLAVSAFAIAVISLFLSIFIASFKDAWLITSNLTLAGAIFVIAVNGSTEETEEIARFVDIEEL